MFFIAILHHQPFKWRHPYGNVIYAIYVNYTWQYMSMDFFVCGYSLPYMDINMVIYGTTNSHMEPKTAIYGAAGPYKELNRAIYRTATPYMTSRRSLYGDPHIRCYLIWGGQRIYSTSHWLIRGLSYIAYRTEKWPNYYLHQHEYQV